MLNYPDRSGVFDLPFTKVVTGNTAYTTAHVFCFQGTDMVGLMTKLTFIGGFIDTGATQDIRIYDVTHQVVIAEVTGVSVEFPAIVNLGTLSNLSEGHAIWEVQQRRFESVEDLLRD
jgi:hypothetical protein